MNFQWKKKGIIIEIPDSIDPDALKEALEYLKKLQASANKQFQERAYVDLQNNNAKHNQPNQISEENNSDQPRLVFSDFSFSKSRKALEDYKEVLSDSVGEERRAEL